MFRKSKKEVAAAHSSVKGLLTCPDEEFVQRFDALWESLKDENGRLHLYCPEESLITANSITPSLVTANSLVIGDRLELATMQTT